MAKAGRVPIGTIITETEYESLRLMLRSSDEANWEVARQILNGCDDQKSIYWIWILSKDWSGKMVNLRTKASREFSTSVELFTNAWTNSEKFAEWLVEKGWMTEEIFQRLKLDILELVAKRARCIFYDVHTTIVTGFKEYDPKNKQVKITNGLNLGNYA